MAYIWADQTDRLHRTRLACDEAARLASPIARANAVEWLAKRLASPPAEGLHLVFHTVVLQYLSVPAQRQVARLLETAGATASPKAPLAHLSMEADGTAQPGTALHLRLWPGNLRIPLGRCDFHGRWVDWQAPSPRQIKQAGSAPGITTSSRVHKAMPSIPPTCTAGLKPPDLSGSVNGKRPPHPAMPDALHHPPSRLKPQHGPNSGVRILKPLYPMPPTI
jgi:hypothetical protein